MHGRVACATLVLLTAACANPRTPERLGGGGRLEGIQAHPTESRPVGFPRPFGQRFERFGDVVRDEVRWYANDFGRREKQLSQDWASYRAVVAGDLEETHDLIRFAPRAISIDAGLHWDSLKQTMGDIYTRAWDDARVYPERFWYDLKILE